MSKELLALAIATNDEARMMSVGIARSGVEVDVFDDRDRPLRPGEVGEVVARGDTVMSGYWNLPEESTAALRSGWLHTGDLGAIDERGFLTLLDRTKDLVISGGSNIYPREVEEVLLEDPDLSDVAVIGVPDPEWGESVMAVLVANPGATLDLARLERLCLDRIARFKRPKHWRLVDALPKNSAGKVLKRELRKRFEDEAAAADRHKRWDKHCACTVILANARIQDVTGASRLAGARLARTVHSSTAARRALWIPAFAGMTKRRASTIVRQFCPRLC